MRWFLPLLLVGPGACDQPTDGGGGEPASLVVVSGDDQTGRAGQALPAPVVFELRDGDGQPVASRAVSFTIRSGGGRVDPMNASTGADGRASTTWTLGDAVGTQQLQAAAAGLTATARATAEAGEAVEVEVTPDSALLAALGDSVELMVVVRDAGGNVLADATVTWSTSDAGVVSVADGWAKALGNGVATVTAASGGASGTAKVVVQQAVASLAVTPGTGALHAIGDTLQLAALAEDANGADVADAAVSWTSLDGGVATVTAGQVEAVSNGTARIVASSGGAADTAVVEVIQVAGSVTVTPAADTLFIGDTLTVRASAADSNGVAMTPAVTWTTSDATLLELVTGTDSVAALAALAAGTARVVASMGTVADTGVVLVQGAAAEVDVTPVWVELDVAGTQSLALEARTAEGQLIIGPRVTWASADEAVATVADGVVTGVAEGVTGVSGQVDAVADTATVAVLGPSSLLSTAFFEGVIDTTVAAGSVVEVPIRLDLSRPSADGDLGSVQLELAYDTTVLAYDSAATALSGTSALNAAAGIFSFALVATAAQGSGDLTLVTVSFTVDPAAAAGSETTLTLTYTDAPSDTGVNDYAMPVVAVGRLRIGGQP